jgi:hypothetical protein
MVISVLQVTLSVLIAMFVLRVTKNLLLTRSPSNPVGLGLAAIIG